MEIITANLFDLKALQKLERESFDRDAWPLFDLVAVLTFGGVIRLKAVLDGEMAGFVAGDPHPHDGWGWIATIAVDPRFRRRGIGTSLLHSCEAQMGVPRSRLTVRASNHGAIMLYERERYQIINTWNAYYNDGENAIVMEKIL